MAEERKLKVRARYVTKQYDLLVKKSDKVKALFNPFSNGLQSFWSLKGISFDVYEGETIGLIGVNGSGKSTLSNIISGIIPPTSGELEVNGETSIIAIGAGLRGQLTGRENIHLKSLMMGMTNSEIAQHMEDVINFADLGDFIDQPVKSYSSGMKSRLGFSIAAYDDPDILIIDEALSVGDETFYQKALDKMVEFREQGKTIFFVSHVMSQVEMFTDKTAWIQYGELKEFGPTAEVLAHYKEWNSWFKKLPKSEKGEYQAAQKELQKEFTVEQLRKNIENDPEHDYSATDAKILTASAISGDKMPATTLVLWTALTVLWFVVAYMTFH
ncbi:ABC transporter ATP-binding protein [Periweissella cryptocerci]|uniref:ABC transporter ATP-binding protein n=1 Tax=Periweissella cryptocerci TaxID=2506420 RepID=A0A4P6YVJ6_9LACO|nr:ABC transporter ATP-binding protein [Periweissella cryptocerci]QBO36747.1 ABC transporter ATP-binding protein [Periweissella cryptocerci]